MASQIEQGRRWCAEMGAEIVAVLVDNDLSASRYATEVRKDFEEALRLLATGAANTLWTWENSRAQRELDTFVRLRSLLVQVGGFWAYDDRLYDMNDPDDRIDTAEDAMDAERESEKLRKRVKRGVTSRAHAGLWAGPLFYGFRIFYDPETGEAGREIDETLRPIVEEIVDTLLETGNSSALAADLNRRGIPAPRAQMWRADHVRKLHLWSTDAEGWAKFTAKLTPEQLDSAYTALTSGRGESPSHVAKLMNRSRWPHPFPGKWSAAKVRNIALNPALAGLRVFRGKVIGQGTWPAIIDEDKHRNLVAKMSDPSRAWVRDGTRVKYLLGGILLCGVCDEPVTTSTRDGAKVYRCPVGHTSRNMAKTDAVVVEAVLRRLSSDNAEELFRYEEQAEGLSAALEEAKTLRARLNGFADAAAEGDLSPERLSRIEAKLLPKIKAAEERAKRASVSPLVAELVGPGAPEVCQSLPIMQRREVLRAVLRPKLIPAVGQRGRAPFNPKLITFSWLGVPAAVPGIYTA